MDSAKRDDCAIVESGAAVMKKLIVKIFRFYQKYISVYTRPHCRFIPVCSSYAIEAVEKYGGVKGLILTVWRILRCNPFCKGGYDPVP